MTRPGLTDTEKDGIRSLFALSKELRTMRTPPIMRVARRRRGPRTCLPRCPKCQEQPTSYLELWKDHSIDFGTDDQGRPLRTGNMESGEPYAVNARCECGHVWRLKGVLQITDLDDLV